MGTIRNVNKILDQFDFFSTPDAARRKTTSVTTAAELTAGRPKQDRPPLAATSRPAAGDRITYVEDTPSPKKDKKTRSLIPPNKMARRTVIHATPCPPGPPKKTKKLFDEDAHLRRELEDSNDKTVDEGDEETSALVLNPDGAKVSSYFKPKAARAADKENGESSREECDLSFNSLKKRERQRMRNPYVIRFSDVYTSKEIEKLIGDNNKEAEKAAESPETTNAPASDRTDQTTPDKTSSTGESAPSPDRLLLSSEVNAEAVASASSARFKTSLFYTHLSGGGHDSTASFTRVTRQLNESEEDDESGDQSASESNGTDQVPDSVTERNASESATTGQASAAEVTESCTELKESVEESADTEKSLPVRPQFVAARRSKSASTATSKKRLSSSHVIVRHLDDPPAKNLTQVANLNESEIDRILHLNCRRAAAAEGPPTRLSYNLAKHVSGHQIGHIEPIGKLTKSGSVGQLTQWKPMEPMNTGLRRSSMTKKKRFHLACLELTTGQLDKVRKCVSSLNGSFTSSKPHKSTEPDTRVHASLKTHLGKETTHVLIDFDVLFRDSAPSLKTKCQLLLSVLNKCKIVRYEWLVFSNKKGTWLNESKFLLDKYLDQDCEYDEQDFDIRLVKLIQSLEKGDAAVRSLDMFKSIKNVHVLSEREGRRSDEEEEGDNEENKWEDENDFECSFLSMGESLNDCLNEILRKCGAHVTSRLKLAETIIAIDKLSDLDNEDEDDEQIHRDIKLEQKYFADRVVEIQQTHRSRPHVQVISSEWILDCILEMELLDVASYVLVDIHPGAISTSAFSCSTSALEEQH